MTACLTASMWLPDREPRRRTMVRVYGNLLALCTAPVFAAALSVSDLASITIEKLPLEPTAR